MMDYKQFLRRGIEIGENKGIYGVTEAVWRNALRRTIIGKGLSSIFDEILVEKLVMAPRVGYWPQIRRPRSFNEKIAHRKLLTNDERFAIVSDKYLVRDYVRERVGDHILNEIYHITNYPKLIPLNKLPDSFVIKTGNKGVIIVDDKYNRDYNKIILKCRDKINKPYGTAKNEYWYNKCVPKIIIEKKLKGLDYDIPIDYKFFVFHGQVEYVQVNVDRFGDHTKSVYDKDWTYIDVKYNYPKGPKIPKPTFFDEMKRIAEKLARDFDFMRVDLYQTENENIIFGEMTPAPASGCGGFRPIAVDFEFGEKW